MNFSRTRCHKKGNSDIVYNDMEQCIQTIGSDNKMNKYDIITENLITENVLAEEVQCLALNKDQIVFGIQDTAYIVKDLDFQNKIPILQLESQISNIVFDAKYMGFIGEQNDAVFYDCETLQQFKINPGHQKPCCDLQFSFDSKFAFTTAQDGFLHVYDMENRVVSKQIKISKMNEQFQQLKASWHPKKNQLAIPGLNYLQVLNYNGQQFQYQKCENIIHQNEISIVNLQENVCITCGLDREIIVWSFNDDLKINLIKQFKIEQNITNLIYQQETLVILDIENHIGFYKYLIPEFDVLKELDQIEEKEEEKVIENVEPENNLKKINQNKVEQIIDVLPQNILFPSSTTLEFGRKFLCWNLMGTISIRHESSFSFIDIEFADKNFKRNQIFPDNLDICMASMNYIGAVLASRPKEQDIDSYEDENANDSQKFSHLQFKQFSPLFQECNWVYKFPEGEFIESVCISSEFIAVATDLQVLRIFNFGGVEYQTISYEKPLVCIQSYENILVLVMHSGPPIYGCQQLIARIFVDLIVQKEIFIPLTPYEELSWFGFSEEGMMMMQDTSGQIRVYVQEKWQNVQKDKKFWLIGAQDYDLTGINLRKYQEQPEVQPRPLINIKKFEFQFLQTQDTYWREKLNLFLLNKIKIDHETYRFNQWNILKQIRDQKDPLCRISNSIWEQQEIQKIQDDNNRLSVDIFREFISKDDFERALQFVQNFIKNERMLMICQTLCNKLNLQLMSSKINYIIQVQQRKNQIQNIKEQKIEFKQEIVQQKTHELRFNTEINQKQQNNQDDNDLHQIITPNKNMEIETDENPFKSKNEQIQDKNIFKEISKFGLQKKRPPLDQNKKVKL